jgi:hypothetical protein
MRRPIHTDERIEAIPAMWYGGTLTSAASVGSAPRNSTLPRTYPVRCKEAHRDRFGVHVDQNRALSTASRDPFRCSDRTLVELRVRHAAVERADRRSVSDRVRHQLEEHSDVRTILNPRRAPAWGPFAHDDHHLGVVDIFRAAHVIYRYL